jgi:hypothetical protein
LSYAKNCRNTYGENDKSSRKNIPLRKRLVNKANRHAARQRLHEASGIPVAERAERVGEQVRTARAKVWRKQPDLPLRQVLHRKQARSGRSPAAARQCRQGVQLVRVPVSVPEARTCFKRCPGRCSCSRSSRPRRRAAASGHRRIRARGRACSVRIHSCSCSTQSVIATVPPLRTTGVISVIINHVRPRAGRRVLCQGVDDISAVKALMYLVPLACTLSTNGSHCYS